MVEHVTRQYVNTTERGSKCRVHVWVLRKNGSADVYDPLTYIVPMMYGPPGGEPMKMNGYWIEQGDPYPVSSGAIDNSKALFLGPLGNFVRDPGVQSESKKDRNLPVSNRRQDTAVSPVGSGRVLWAGDPDIEEMLEQRGTAINAGVKGLGTLAAYAASEYHTILIADLNDFNNNFITYELLWKVTFNQVRKTSDGNQRFYDFVYNAHIGIKPDGCYFPDGMYFGVKYRLNRRNQLLDKYGMVI